jgi:hypothetical protein
MADNSYLFNFNKQEADAERERSFSIDPIVTAKRAHSQAIFGWYACRPPFTVCAGSPTPRRPRALVRRRDSGGGGTRDSVTPERPGGSFASSPANIDQHVREMMRRRTNYQLPSATPLTDNVWLK